MTQKAVQSPPLARSTFQRDSMKVGLAIFWATGAFLGYIPVAPGTFGTILGIILFLLTNPLTMELQILLFLLSLLFALFSTKIAIDHFGKEDPSQVVIDEILGIWLALLFFESNLKNIALAFIFFRIFDIIKPFPVGYIDRKLKGAWGVICDDLAAGMMAKGLLWLLGKI